MPREVPDLPVHRFDAPDGQRLAWRELGEGRPLVLVHGYFSTGVVNWVQYGHAARIAEEGYRVVMPDLRGHGESAKPHDADAWPRDVLADDVLALVDHLGLDQHDHGYDLGGYSLGARTVVRMLVRGATPRRAVIAGMGLSGMTDADAGTDHYRRVLTRLGSFAPGDPEFLAQAFLRTVGGDPQALLRVLDTNVDTSADELGGVVVPSLVLMGEEDLDHGSGPDLAAALPRGTAATVPGSHMGAVARPELGEAIAGWLGPARDARG
ncbi:MAG TPA: alpha/beta fold hydrolase [Marmoricola sp.]|nr:alpha/beta fold hydrolase [Marmoricola sp.]